jgi:hypothetical protein
VGEIDELECWHALVGRWTDMVIYLDSGMWLSRAEVGMVSVVVVPRWVCENEWHDVNLGKVMVST